jgi:alkanesulfonate monooxygenase SsuD/methylene tetrahydromethanopterin reductase-like flavin-dependent oxidoreductase (luciferase family)
MKIGIGLPNQVRDLNPAIVPRWAAQAEQAGFSTLATIGRHAYPGVSDTVALAAAAGVTSGIGLMSGLLLAPTWPGELLAKELAGIDGVSGNRLTLGLGVGGRPDDFVVPDHGMAGRGTRLDRDLETFRDVWEGKPFGGGPNPAVPAGTRQIPMLFGGFTPATMARMARWGEGYIGLGLPAPLVEPSFDAARAAWMQAGREGLPRLVTIPYFALGDPDRGRANIGDYYAWMGEETAAMAAGAVCGSVEEVRAFVDSFAAIGVDEIIFNPATDDVDEVSRLADIVL